MNVQWERRTREPYCWSCPLTVAASGSGTVAFSLMLRPNHVYSPGIEALLETDAPINDLQPSGAQAYPFLYVRLGEHPSPDPFPTSDVWSTGWGSYLDGQVVTLHYALITDSGRETLRAVIDTSNGVVKSFERRLHHRDDLELVLWGTGAFACGDEPPCTSGDTRCRVSETRTCGADARWTTTSACSSASAPYCEIANGCSSTPPSCQGLAEDCGGAESCCASPLVTGGQYSFYGRRATMQEFRLDKYEVTVGRFRRFVEAWADGYRPQPGAGKHVHMNDGQGLYLSQEDLPPPFERGWTPGWSDGMPASASAWNDALNCEAQRSWSATPVGEETYPINCVNWYEATAFCIWDGGFLPTFMESDYARAGGDEQRVHPWSTPPDSTALDVTHRCLAPGCVDPVGTHPAGTGRYGQAELEGNILEWEMDRNPIAGAYMGPFANVNYAQDKLFATRSYDYTAAEAPTRSSQIGFRCARVP
jgi:formylglycine-generating enzyme required for sulfatase activity